MIDNASDDGSWDEAAVAPACGSCATTRTSASDAPATRPRSSPAGRHLVFLNFDCEPEAGWLDALVRCADDDPGIGAAQAVVLQPDGTVNTAGNRLHYLGFSWAPSGGRRAHRAARAR